MSEGFIGPLQVRVIESESDFAALAPAWESLQSDAAISSVFETFDWQHLWWRTYGRGQPLRLMVATAGGATVGILPLYIGTMSLLPPSAGPPSIPFSIPFSSVRLLRFVGDGGDTYPDDLGPVLAKGREVEVARALADAVLALPGWDVLALVDMQPENAFVAALGARAAAAGLATRSGRSERITYIDLPASYADWLQSLHRDRRYQIRNIRKKAATAHPMRFFVWEDQQTLEQGIATLVELHHKRWKDSGQPHAFSTPAYVEFHRAVMMACHARGRLRLYCLELSGTIAAMYYFYKFRDRVYLMQSGFDPDLSRVKPGQVLLGFVIEHAIGEGEKVLDFLRGTHRYKEELASGERETVYLTVLRRNLAASLYLTRRIWLPALKARLRRSWGRFRKTPEPSAPPTD